MSNFDKLNSGKDMSIEAFEKARPKLAEVEKTIILALVRRGKHGATDEELVDELRRIHGDRLPSGARAIKDTIAPARNSLASGDRPLVRKSGDKRLTTSGRRANVWIIVDPKNRFKQERTAVSRKGGFNLFELNRETGNYDLIGYCLAKKNADEWIVTGDTRFVTSFYGGKHNERKGK